MAIDVIPNPVITPQEEISKGITGGTIDYIYESKIVRRFDNFPNTVVLV